VKPIPLKKLKKLEAYMLFYCQQSMTDRQSWAAYTEVLAKRVPEPEVTNGPVAIPVLLTSPPSAPKGKDLKRKMESSGETQLELTHEKSKRIKKINDIEGLYLLLVAIF
jgi:hypothetical protein